MSADSADAHMADTQLVVDRLMAVATPRDRGFWAGLAVAALLHALILTGIGRAVPRHVGDEDGSADGISVSVVTEADLRSTSTVDTPPQAPAAAPQPAAPKPVPQLKPTQQEPMQQDAAATPPPPEASPPEQDKQPETPTPPKPEPQNKIAAAIEKDVPELLTMPGAGDKPQKKEAAAPPKKPESTATKPQPTQQPKAPAQPKRTASLDLSQPPPAFTGSAGGMGRRAGMERPPGITRSGANDEFARGVIRALQQTMPQLREVLGRVTVRITLNENGNVTDVQVVRPANIATIDQSVVFAAKQTSYPFPPPNSNMADRTFLVTYIYH